MCIDCNTCNCIIITTNNSGEFTFTFDTSAEGVYNITLIFQKKGYDDRRFRCVATRELTEEDRKQAIRDEAIKPTYSNLVKKMVDYRGRYMLYTLNIKDVSATPTGYVTFAGMSKTKSGVYKELVVIRTTDAPGWYAGEQVRMYTMGEYSKEICGGPHATHTGELVSFKIQKEESSSAGVRRIKAVIGADPAN